MMDTPNWFVDGDIEKTIYNLLDVTHIYSDTDREAFANALYTHLRYLAPYTLEEFNQVIVFIFDHLDELFTYYVGKP